MHFLHHASVVCVIIRDHCSAFNFVRSRTYLLLWTMEQGFGIQQFHRATSKRLVELLGIPSTAGTVRDLQGQQARFGVARLTFCTFKLVTFWVRLFVVFFASILSNNQLTGPVPANISARSYLTLLYVEAVCIVLGNVNMNFNSLA